MEGKKECVKIRETKEREFGDESLYTVLFTAGAALLMVGLKRAIMTLFIEQWRLWVFLILNLVLLAIFFTSMHSNPSDRHNQESGGCGGGGDNNVKRKIKQQHGCEDDEESKSNDNGNVIKVKIERSKRRDEESKFRSDDDDDQNEAYYSKSKSNDNGEDEEQTGNGDYHYDDDDEYESEMEAPRLSKEELNERVEAFIATFRQHLVLDARQGRQKVFSRRQRENKSFINLQKGNC